MEHPDEFFYLNQGDSAEIEGLMGNDDKEFEATREAFKVGYCNKSQTTCVHIYCYSAFKFYIKTKFYFIQLLGFSEHDESSIFTILAGILHLGNVKFQAGGKTRSDSESCLIHDEDAAIKTMATLLEIDEEGIRKWLCYRQIVTARETFVKPMSTEAVSSLPLRNSFCKHMLQR